MIDPILHELNLRKKIGFPYVISRTWLAKKCQEYDLDFYDTLKEIQQWILDDDSEYEMAP